jgi:hyperosmotically inducible protein
MKNIGNKSIGLALLVLGASVPARAEQGSGNKAAANAALAKKIQVKLEEDSDLKNNTIEVTVDRGVATLKGAVDTREERAKAESLAKINGVRRVDDHIDVDASPSKGGMSDAAITSRVKADLMLEGRLGNADVAVTTHHGVVTLSGTVPSDAARERAIQAAREENGVVRVDDKLTILSNAAPPLVPLP